MVVFYFVELQQYLNCWYLVVYSHVLNFQHMCQPQITPTKYL